MDLHEQLSLKAKQIPSELSWKLSPARFCLYEWRDYYVDIPGADRIRIGDRWEYAKKGNVFLIRFENQLGLASIQSFNGNQPLGSPTYVEVISPKFPSISSHLTFYNGLLEDLFSRASRLPFTISAPTSRGVTESYLPPSPLFVLHFLCQFFPAIQESLRIIQTSPHQQLVDLSEKVPLAQAEEADADVLIKIIQNPSEWVPASGFPLAERLQGYSPTRVWQRLPQETNDTAENRFVLHFLQQIIFAAQSPPSQSWWNHVPEERQQIIHGVSNYILQILYHPIFSEVGQMRRLPMESMVLLRRDGYRKILELWQLFNHARRPLFAPLQQAIDVHDVATLYEIWVFFALIEEIAVVFGETPVIDLRFSELGALGWQAEAGFGVFGKLVYNRTQPSYSVPLRPDFSWYEDDHLKTVFDAKFRLERQMLESEVEEATTETVSKRADLYKMHTYRDALGVSAAISIYPGDTPVLFDKELKRKGTNTLGEIIKGQFEGIGALPMRPGV